jgi:hypothetical protein
MLKRRSDEAPLRPPYPSPGAFSGWRRWLLFVSWPVAIGLLMAQVNIGWFLFLPGLLWFCWMVGRSPRLREPALDGLEARASQLTSEERDEELETILRLYGGRPELKVQQRVEAIRAQPMADRNRRRSA